MSPPAEKLLRILRIGVALLAGAAILATLLVGAGGGGGEALTALQRGLIRIPAWVVASSTGQDADALLREGDPPGFLYIETPQLYTRERLVNDRFRQANWLRAVLDETERDDARFAAATARVRRATDVTLAAEAGANAPDGSAATPGEPAPPGALSPRDQFRNVFDFRSEVRNELMDAQLDDGHDLEGNTLYRLNFNAVAMPWSDRREPPGSAVFIVEARSPRAPEGAEARLAHARQNLTDDAQLLEDWRREMQIFLTNVVDLRSDEFRRSGALFNPTDPKEDVALDVYLRRELIVTFLDLVAAQIAFENPQAFAPTTAPGRCATWPESLDERRQCIAGWVDERWVLGTEVVNLPPTLQGGLRKALGQADRINRKLWALDNPPRGPGPGPGGPPSPPGNAAGTDGQPPDPASAPPGQSSPGSSDAEPPPPEYHDPGMKRALIRLLLTYEAIRDAWGDDLPKAMLRFREDGRQPDAMGAVFARYGSLLFGPEDDVEAALVAGETRPGCGDRIGDPWAYGACVFRHERLEDDLHELMTRFIHARVGGRLQVYGAGSAKILDFLDVSLRGCNLTRCSLVVDARRQAPAAKSDRDRLCETEVDRIQPVTPDFTERRTDMILGCRLRAWLDDNRNDLAVYAIDPRASGEATARQETRSSDLAAGLGRDGVGVGIGRRDVADREATRLEASVIGFSEIVSEGAPLPSPKSSVVFGWVVRPLKAGDQWQPAFERLSAVLSAPSWWKRLEFEVTACWAKPAVAREMQGALFEAPRAICGEAAPGAEGLGGARPALRRTLRIQLPRRVEDVTDRFSFDFIKAPYFDSAWNRKISNRAPTGLEAGRPGELVLPGERLWRGTVVTLGQRPAESVLVLPNMKGVIARFDCVPFPAGEVSFIPLADRTAQVADRTAQGEAARDRGSGRGGPPPVPHAMVTVWTSEGNTVEVPVLIHPFVQRTPDDMPCRIGSP